MKKIKDKNEATTVASSRSPKATDKNTYNKKTGRQAQDEFTNMLKSLSEKAGIKMWSEPDANTINNLLNKKNKKKLN